MAISSRGGLRPHWGGLFVPVMIAIITRMTLAIKRGDIVSRGAMPEELHCQQHKSVYGGCLFIVSAARGLAIKKMKDREDPLPPIIISMIIGFLFIILGFLVKLILKYARAKVL